MAKLFCDTAETCCAVARLPYDRAACEALLVHGWAGTAVVPPGWVFDRVAAQSCLDAYQSQFSKCYEVFSPPECASLQVPMDPATVHPYRHGVKGDACTLSCLEAYACTRVGNGDEQVAACYEADGLFCSEHYESPTAATCVSISKVGGSCRASFECEGDEYCNIAQDVSLPGDGTCALPKADGQPCRNGDECVSGGCDGQCRHPAFADPDTCLGVSKDMK